MGAFRKWMCKAADWTFWPVLKGLLLGGLMFVTLCLAYGIARVVKWLWGLIP